jgi:hypothetical protein
MSAKQSGAGRARAGVDKATGGAMKPLIGIAAGAAVGSAAIAAALIYAGRLRNPFIDAASQERRRTPAKSHGSTGAPAAFDGEVGAPGAVVRVRDAGPANVRDPERDREWDLTDETSDESFPASDPPATY